MRVGANLLEGCILKKTSRKNASGSVCLYRRDEETCQKDYASIDTHATIPKAWLNGHVPVGNMRTEETRTALGNRIAAVNSRASS